MKALFTAVLILFTTACSFSKTSQKKIIIDTIQFQSKDNKPIANLSNGEHTFYSANGTKLVLMIENNKVAKYTYYSPKGEVITNAKLSDMFRNCRVCSSVQFPDGHVERVCNSLACTTADDINKKMGN